MRTGSGLGEDRRRWLIEHVATRGSITTAGAAAELSVSHDSIRRDLQLLASNGLVRRVHGGAVAIAASATPSHAPDLRAYERLAAAVARLIPTGSVVVLDGGITSEAIAAGIPIGSVAVVVTPSPVVASRLVGRADLQLVLTGGVVDPIWGVATGARTIDELRQMTPDVAVVGVCGIDPAHGATTSSAAEVDSKRAMIDRAKLAVVAATNDKVGHVAPFAIRPASAIDHLVLANAPTRPQQHQAFVDAGTRIHVA